MCNITIDTTGKDPDQLFANAESEIDAHGSFQPTGDRSLTFQVSVPLFGRIEGSLHVGTTQADVVITKKPGLLSCNRIEREIERFLNGDGE